MSTGWAVRAVGIDAHQVPPCMLLVLSSVPSTISSDASRAWEPPPIRLGGASCLHEQGQRLPGTAPPEGRAAPEGVVLPAHPAITRGAGGW